MKIFCLAILFFASATIATAQEFNSFHLSDTLTFKALVFSAPTTSLSRPSLLLPAWLYDTLLTRDYPTSYLGYALTSEPATSDKRADLSWQMGFNRYNDDPLGSFRMVLGAVSAGGAAYLAYQHTRKYGFLK